ncbi:MAG: sulfatase [Planctomycetes bacterium]|nr:sulfatase [Planctomycetota bacterium]MCB9905845.1 sulfatase [Planctomycetota bacterium]
MNRARRHGATLLLLCALAASSCDDAPDLGTMRVETVHKSLVADASAWQVLEERPDAPVGVAVLQPWEHPKLDSIATPSLELVPPARVRLDVGRVPKGGQLRFRVGVHHTAYETEQTGAVRFKLTDGEQLLYDSLVPIGSGVEMAERTWQRGQVSLDGHVRLVLETSFEGEGDPAPSSGFAALEVVSERLEPRGHATREHPSVVLVVMDTLRADRLSCYGYARELTPNLDALAAEGTLFEETYSASSWTWPSTASIMTALPPPAHGLIDTSSCFLSHELLTVAEAFQDAGWTTAGFSTNPLVREDIDFDQGFEEFHVYELSPTREVFEDVERWIAAQGERRFFLYLQFVDPHEYLPSPELLERWGIPEPADFDAARWRGFQFAQMRGLDYDAEKFAEYTRYYSSVYDATVAEADEFVGALRASLAAHGHADRAVIAFTSDHGEEFLEHGQIMHTAQLYDESVHVPLIIAGPGIPRGVHVQTRVENRNLAPTLLARAGVEARENLVGLDLLDEADVRESAELPVFSSTNHGRWFRDAKAPPLKPVAVHAVRHAGMLYLWMPDPPHGEQDDRLYDLSADPGALHDIADEQPETCERMRVLIADWLEHGEKRRPGNMSGGASSLDLLKKLGYVDD